MEKQAYSSLHLLGLKWTEGGGGKAGSASLPELNVVCWTEMKPSYTDLFILEGKTPLLLLMPATLLP